MLKFQKYINYQFRLLDGEPSTPPPGNPTPPANPPADPTADLKAQNAALLARLEALEKGLKPTPPADPTLSDQVEADRKAKEKKAGETKELSSAIAFTMKAPEWLKINATLLPKNVAGIFEAAEKANFGDEIEKANEIKVGILQEFFSIQANLDLLTETQKIHLADFKALTKNEKQDRVKGIYESIFEPTFEALRRQKKIEQVSKGLGDPSNAEKAHEQKMIELSMKKYLKK